MPILGALLAKQWFLPVVIGAGIGLALLIGAAVIFHKGQTLGSSSVTAAVQQQTVKAIESARKSREATDAKILRSPYADRVDGLP